MKWMSLLAGGLLLSSLACSKPAKPEEPGNYDHMMKSETPPAQHLLNKTFTVQDHNTVEFEVPARCLTPRLHGNFSSYRYGTGGGRVSDEAANIDLFLFDEQQYNDFMHGQGDSVTRSVKDGYQQDVDWALSATSATPRKYYLVFNNSTGKPKNKVVSADFMLSFEP